MADDDQKDQEQNNPSDRKRGSSIRFKTIQKALSPEEEEAEQKKWEDELVQRLEQATVWDKVTDVQVLARMPTRQQEPDKPHTLDTPPSDPEQFYTWDYAVCMKLGSEQQITIKKIMKDGENGKPKKVKETLEEREWCKREAARIVGNLENAGLKIFLYKSVQQDELYVLIGATEERLRYEADRVNLDLPVDADVAIEVGKTIRFPLAVRVGDPEYPGVSKDLFFGLYAPYHQWDDLSDRRNQLYTVQQPDDPFHKGSVFRSIDRLKLTLSIIEAERVLGGASLKLRGMAKDKNHPVRAFYPLHEEIPKNDLERDVHGVISLFKPPIDKFRDYFGEQIALYFAFLSSYSIALVIPAIIGFAFFIWQVGGKKVDIGVRGMPAFALFMAIWATLFLEAWKRRTAELRTIWGQTHFLEKETDRPEFEGEWEVSPITGKFEETFPTTRRVIRLVLSQSVVISLVVLVVGLVVGVFVLRRIMVTKIADQTIPIVIASAINAVQIQVMNIIYGVVSVAMNDYENHRTETEYENALIAKSFLFKFVNSYQSLFYIAFVKRTDDSVRYCKDSIYNLASTLQKTNPSVFSNLTSASTMKSYLEAGYTCEQALGTTDTKACAAYAKAVEYGPDYRGDCLQELAVQLAIIFVLAIVLNNAIEFGSLFAKNFLTNKRESANPAEQAAKKNGAIELGSIEALPPKSHAEEQFEQEQYEGTFADYDELIVQFGYVVLFVVAFPLAPLAALLNNLVENRLDAHKILRMTRRPHPRGAYDMGVWQSILQILAWVAIATNVGLVAFTPTDYFPDHQEPVHTGYGYDSRFAVFLIAEHILVLIKATIAQIIPDEPMWVKNLAARNDHLVDVYVGL